MHLGDVYILLGEMDKAEKALGESIGVFESNGDKHSFLYYAVKPHLNILIQEHAEKAMSMLGKTCNVLRKHGNTARYIEALVMRALANDKLGKLNEALINIEEAMSLHGKNGMDFWRNTLPSLRHYFEEKRGC